MLFKKITRRWLVNGLGVVVILLLILEVAAVLSLRSFYYQQVQNSLYTRAKSFSDMLAVAVQQPDFDFEANARTYLLEFPDKEKMEFQLLTAKGDILASSTGFLPDEKKCPDYQAAVLSRNEGKESRGVWTGKNAVGQKVTSLTLLVNGADGSVCGGIRYLVALDKVDAQIAMLTAVMIALGLAVLFFVILSSIYFVNGILRPLTEIGQTAKQIAKGDYSCRIEQHYDDEIGELCNTINNMAADIEAADALQNEFVASISHELRTPLTAIKGWSETLRDSGLQDEALLNKGLEVISSEAERLTGIVEELLDFSKIQQTETEFTWEKLDIFAELEEAVFLFRDQAKRKGLVLQCVQQEDLPPLCGDRDRLRQVFANILDNAIKYSREQGTVRVDAAVVGNTVQIVISDSGIGIAENELPRIKEKFYRVDNQLPGSGIGLAVADEIVAAHGGTLEIDSTKGVGTVVTVTLPIQ